MPIDRIARALIALGLLALAACQPQLNSSLPSGEAAYRAIPAEAERLAGAYLLQPGDIVTVHVFEEPGLTLEQVPIDNAGNLYLPLIGQVEAAGRTQADVSAEIEQAYGKSYLRDPRVAVIVNETLSNTISVEGEVVLPGVYPVQPGATLLSALAQARSPTPSAKLDEVLVFRTVGGRRMGARFDLVEIRAGRSPDPQVLAGDVVVVGYSRLRGGYRDILQAAPLLNVFTDF